MGDALDTLLQRFDLKSRVFYAGNLCSLVNFDASQGVGHLHLLRRGELELIAPDGRSQRLAEPHLLFFPRPTSHRIRADQPEGADLICASVELGASPASGLVQGLPDAIVAPLAALPSLAPVLDALFAEAFAEHSGRDAALDRLSEVVLILLIRHGFAQGWIRSGVLAGLGDARLAPALKAMHDEPARAWTLEVLAARAGMSRARFAVHFVRVVGQPAGEYLMAWRIGIAQQSLLRGRPVKVVAGEVGYGTPGALTRAFTQQLGMTPSAWLAERSRATTAIPP